VKAAQEGYERGLAEPDQPGDVERFLPEPNTVETTDVVMRVVLGGVPYDLLIVRAEQ